MWHCSCIRFWNLWGVVRICARNGGFYLKFSSLAFISDFTRNGHVIHIRKIIVDNAVWSFPIAFIYLFIELREKCFSTVTLGNSDTQLMYSLLLMCTSTSFGLSCVNNFHNTSVLIRNSVVGIATAIRVGRPGVLIPIWTGVFLDSKILKAALGITQVSNQWVPEFFPLYKSAGAWLRLSGSMPPWHGHRKLYLF